MTSNPDTENDNCLYPELTTTLNRLAGGFGQITSERKDVLKFLTTFIQSRIDSNQKVYLNFICTHNSRRSHLAQLWAQAAAYFYDVPGVDCFSGGTEATAFNLRAVDAMKEAGFRITISKDGVNPVYEVGYAPNAPFVIAFSKKYDDPFNHDQDFAAIMTCAHADENCPLVLGASARIALTYDDPKEFDGTALESLKYKERVDEIGREILFAFSQVKK
ncbi:protein-tyrosine-phosphatase [soil metagenome]